MRASVVFVLVFLARCDTAPGPAVLDGRPPVLEDFTFTPQRLVYALLPESQIDGDSLRIPITIRVTARRQADPVEEVWYSIEEPSSLQGPLRSGRMAPAGNSRYEQTVNLVLSALELQTYTVLVYAVDASARVSGAVRGSLHYFRSFEPGSPPVIDSLAVPDTLQRPSPGDPAVSLLLVAGVSDPDGLSDVALVEFWNNAAPASRFLMCDDGGATPCGESQESGDAMAGDALFTRRVFITSDNSAGTTTLVFQAIDRAGLKSAIHMRDVVIQ